MGSYKKVGLLAGAASVTLGGLAFGETTPANDVDARLAALEQQYQTLKAETGSNWLNQARQEEIRAMLQEVQADSSTRTSLLQNGGGAGWDNGHFYLASGDGNFRLQIAGQVQTRYTYNMRDQITAADLEDELGEAIDDTDNAGFEMRRTKLAFSGNLFGPDLTYKVQGAFGRDDGVFTLEHAWAAWALGNGWSFYWGQLKAPFLHEELVSSSRQLAVDRSYVNSMFTGGYTTGAGIGFNNDENFKFDFVYSDGAGNANTAWNDSVGTGGTEWSLTARAEFLGAGTWGQFSDYTSLGSSEFGFMIGGAVHWQNGEYGDTGTETELFGWTVDASLEGDGWNAAGYIVGLNTEPNGGASTDDWAFVVQGGAFLAPEKFELFGRWEWLDFDGMSDNINIVTFGANYYIDTRGHAWKWTNDVVWALDNIPSDAAGIGLLTDAFGQEDQLTFRSQMQILF
ncbi:MAG: hypothetical protein HND57_15385 [Planctomycetes bacterium]|nr:hypothetical protein [Planctomycetota bacterium]